MKHLDRIPIRWRRAALATIIITLAMTVLSTSELGDQIEYELAHRLNFHVRSLLGKAPDIHPKLKLFAYDDHAVADSKNPEIPLSDWVALLDGMGKRKPRGVFIDKMFGFLPERPENITAFRDALARNPFVTSAAFVTDYLIRFRPQLDLSRKDFRLERYAESELTAIEWLPKRNPNVYGPDGLVRDAFAHIGHILYPGRGRVEPAIRVNVNTVVPHLFTFAASALRISPSGMTYDGIPLPVDRNGRLTVNFPEVPRLLDATYSLKGTLTKARKGSELEKVDEGDVVLVMPLFYTGNHDHVDTPVGRIPGGLMLASLLNSMLSKEWITPVRGGPGLALLAGIAGTALGAATGAISFWPGLLVALATIIVSGLSLFAYAGMQVPWLYPAVTLFLTGVAAYAVNMMAWSIETRRMRDALRGAVSEEKLKTLISGKGQIQREASERVVTLMFIDIANFSVFAEQTPPKQVFLHLKEILRDVTRIIHKYDGTVDKTLGDGLLCFFGYCYDGEVSENQADQAIRCAVEIQKTNIRRCIDAARSGAPILPFRIGINTGSIYIGDLGDDGRIDFTVIGNGVNYAQRLESNCEHHSIMLSGTTIDFSANFSPKMPGFKRRFIHIKHHEELLEAIEYNPLHDEPQLREQALQEFRKSFNLERKEQRWPVNDPSRLSIQSEFGAAHLIDFSASGICVRLDSYLSKGVSVALTLASADHELRRRLEDRGISIVKTEVRWGKAVTDGYSHGLKFVNLSDQQQGFLFAQLREFFSRNKEVA